MLHITEDQPVLENLNSIGNEGHYLLDIKQKQEHAHQSIKILFSVSSTARICVISSENCKMQQNDTYIGIWLFFSLFFRNYFQ